MASIEFSPGFRAGLPSRLLRSENPYIGDFNPQEMGFLTADTRGNSFPTFYVFSGQKQSIAYCKDNTNSASLITNNCLLRFSFDELRPTTLVEADRIKFISIYKQAIKTGVATWFCFCRNYWPPTNEAIKVMGAHCIIGDIGLIGSGSDLELPDTNILLGNNYRIDNFNINIPYSWTY